MGILEGKERRKFVRISTELPVRLNAPCSAAFAVDMSTGGIGLIVTEDTPGSLKDIVSVKEPVTVEVDMPGGETLPLAASIAWSRVVKESGVKSIRIGLRFIEMPSGVKQRVDEFLKVKALELAFPEGAIAEEDIGL